MWDGSAGAGLSYRLGGGCSGGRGAAGCACLQQGKAGGARSCVCPSGAALSPEIYSWGNGEKRRLMGFRQEKDILLA